MAADTQYLSNMNIGGINIYTNPLFHGYEQQVLAEDGELIRCVNLDSTPLGAKSKRAGYISFLNNPDNSQVNSLFGWEQDNGTSSFLYRFSGSVLSFYDVGQGTATSWTPCVNGTFNGGSHVGAAILGNTLICGDGVNATRHTTDGTTLTNTSLAPVAEFFEQYQNRIFAGGTSSTLFYSTTGDATNWQTSGTSDSSSLTIPGAGKINKVFKLGDRLHTGKTGRNIFRWDGFSLVDMSTTLNMSSPYSYGSVEDSAFWINRLGVYMADINGPKLISNAIGKYFYNTATTGAAGTVFNSAPGGVHRYDYYVAIGSTRDDLTDEPLNNAVVKYNYQKNEFLTYQFADNPTTLYSYKDNSGSQQLVFGNSSGQCFQINGTATSDNGSTIPTVMDMIFTANAPYYDKEWRWFFGFFNPGCEAQISISCTDTFTKGKKNWIDLGDATSGVVRYRFPIGLRSKILYLRIREASKTAPSTFYGATLGFRIVDPG